MIKGYAWSWVCILVAFLIVAAITGNGREAWSIVLWTNLGLFVLLALAIFTEEFLEARDRRRDAKRDD